VIEAGTACPTTSRDAHREVVQIVRAVLRRETIEFHGKVFDLPLA
jgi:alkanesulfonate monooxygenase SsuD/methylene tetrahydromethanopterin reductase-like flavin-dependent oxidoreductase (luciferase family)